MSSNTPGLQKIGNYWHYTIKVNGLRAHGSTRATDLATARKVMEEKRRELLLGKVGATKTQKTFRELVQLWFASNQVIFSLGHIKSSECALRLWVLPVLGKMPLKQIGNASILEVRSNQLAAGKSLTYANNTLRTVKAIFGFAIKMGFVPEIPFNVQRLRVQKKPRVTVPATSLRSFLSTVDAEAQNPHIRVIIRVMIGLGLREAEALGMRWEWFDIPNQTYTVGKAKGKEARVLPVPSWLMQSILEMPKAQISEWVFPSALDGKPHRAQFCKKVLQRVCEKLKLGNVTQHRLRATFASLHAEAGTPVTEIQGMLGHKNIATTMIYVETSLEAKRKAQDALSLKLGLA